MINTQDSVPQLDEVVWQAWVKKNEIRDRIFARRVRILALLAAIGGFAGLLWRFA